MNTERWRIELIRETEVLPVPWRPAPRRAEPTPSPGDHAVAALFAAIELLSYRGPGAQGWAASYRHDPIAFLLDAMSDAIVLSNARGEILFQNAAAIELGLGPEENEPFGGDRRGEERHDRARRGGQRRFERRRLRCRFRGMDTILEIIREV